MIQMHFTRETDFVNFSLTISTINRKQTYFFRNSVIILQRESSPDRDFVMFPKEIPNAI